MVVMKTRSAKKPFESFIRKKAGWVYQDYAGKGKVVQNRILPYFFRNPHLVLHDGAKKPRFVLGYEDARQEIAITAIQQVRNEYVPVGGASNCVQWDREQESLSAKKLRENLGGKHPAEHLLSEFIFRNRKRILAGTKIYLKVLMRSKLQDGIYGPLRDRFFNEKPLPESCVAGNWYQMYELNPNKKRVKELLGLK